MKVAKAIESMNFTLIFLISLTHLTTKTVIITRESFTIILVSMFTPILMNNLDSFMGDL